MKHTENLKNQVEKAESKDGRKNLVENAGMNLTDAEMDNVAGGSTNSKRESRPFPDMQKIIWQHGRVSE